jgi:tetratricopeptide (TPR) repeat protein
MMGGSHRLVSSAILAVLVASSIRASAGEAPGCLDSAAQAALACGAGPRLAHAAGDPAPVAFDVPAAPPPVRPDMLPAPTLAGTSSQRPDREVAARRRDLLVRSIEQLTKLLQATPADSPDQPRLMRRLGDDYAELAADLAREQKKLADLSKDIVTLNPPRSKLMREKAVALGKRVRSARLKTVGYYRALADDHPGYCMFPRRKVRANRVCGDEVLYWLGFEEEQLGEADRAVEAYRQLLAAHPRSPLAMYAYLALGELHFASGEPSRQALARGAYEKVLGWKPDRNPLWGYAAYKLGHVQWNAGEHARALDSFVKVIEFALQHPDSPNAAALARAARRDLVPVYARTGEAAKAWAFFEQQSAGDPSILLAMMESLGRSFSNGSAHEQAAVVYGELVQRGPAERACEYRVGLARATLARDPNDRQPAVDLLGELMASYVTARAGNDAPEAKLRCGNAAAELLTEAAMGWYVEAVGVDGSPGTADRATVDAAAKVLRMLVDNFSAAELAEFEFPRFAKEQWPTPARLHYAYGMLMRAAGESQACARELDAAFDTEPDGPLAGDAVLGAALCWIDTQPALGSKLPAVRELDDNERSMVRALDRALCLLEPPQRSDEGWPAAAVKLARARLYLVEGGYEPAVVALREVALSSHAAGVQAAHLYVLALDQLAARNGALACPDRIADDMQQLGTLYCTRPGRDTRSLCEDLARRRHMKAWLARG